jgi:hypothetical protein
MLRSLRSYYFMATQRQIDAARRNGALSRGPVTPEGRAKSARNSLKHGLSTSKIFVLSNESEESFDKTLNAINLHYQPQSDLERDLCIEIAHARWRLRRLWIIETGMIDREMDRQHTSMSANSERCDEGTRLAGAFETLASPQGPLGLLTTYESRLQRSFNRAVDRLQKIKREKNEKTNPTKDSLAA